jgi:hypothetical protein
MNILKQGVQNDVTSLNTKNVCIPTFQPIGYKRLMQPVGGSLKISISLTRGGSGERSNMWRKVSTTKNTQYMFHHISLFVTDTNVYVKDILLSTDF